MKLSLYFCVLLLTLSACKHKDVAPEGYLKSLVLILDPKLDGVTLKWSPVIIWEEGMFDGPKPVQPAQYEVYLSENDEKSLKKVAIVDGSLQTYTLANQPAGQIIYAQVKAIHPKLTTSESNISTTITGQLGATSLLFPANTPDITFGSWGGSTLLYAGKGDQWTIRLPDGNLRTLKKQGDQPVLSPDGQYIAYLTARNTNTSYNTQLAIQAVGSGAVRLLDTQQAIYGAEWSNNGQWLAYVASEGLWKVNFGSSQRFLITNGPWNANQNQLAWSPDDQSIVIAQEKTVPVTNRYVSNLLTIPANGGQPKPFLVSDWRDSQPGFSPDGQHLAFVSNRSGYQAIWLMNLQTGKFRQLTGSSENFYSINRLDWMNDTQLTYTVRTLSSIDATLKLVTLP